MPIKIPSKRIYDIDHKIIRKPIGKVETQLDNISIVQDYSGLHLSQDFDVSSTTISNSGIFTLIGDVSTQQTHHNSFNVQYPLSTTRSLALGYGEAEVQSLPFKLRIYEDVLPNKLVTQLYGLDAENTPISYQTVYSHTAKPVTGIYTVDKTWLFTEAARENDTVTYQIATSTSGSDVLYDEEKSGQVITADIPQYPYSAEDKQWIYQSVSVASGVENDDIQYYRYTYSYDFSGTNKFETAGSTTYDYKFTLTDTLDWYDDFSLRTAQYPGVWTTGTDNGRKYFEISFRILCARKIVRMATDAIHLKVDTSLNSTYDITGQIYIDIAKQVTISFGGAVLQLSINTENFVNGLSSGDITFSIDNNELMQITPSIKEAMTTVYNANKGGKETVELKCSVNDYYDYDIGEKVIDVSTSSKMLFAVDDEVIPMRMTASGQELPLSTNKDGTPKVYRVVGVKQSQTGIIWQNLTLIEKTT